MKATILAVIPYSSLKVKVDATRSRMSASSFAEFILKKGYGSTSQHRGAIRRECSLLKTSGQQEKIAANKFRGTSTECGRACLPSRRQCAVPRSVQPQSHRRSVRAEEGGKKEKAVLRQSKSHSLSTNKAQINAVSRSLCRSHRVCPFSLSA